RRPRGRRARRDAGALRRGRPVVVLARVRRARRRDPRRPARGRRARAAALAEPDTAAVLSVDLRPGRCVALAAAPRPEPLDRRRPLLRGGLPAAYRDARQRDDAEGPREEPRRDVDPDPESDPGSEGPDERAVARDPDAARADQV